MDALLLHSPFPAMLLNRTVCGYLGIQSGTLRYAAVQRFIPDNMRARLEAFQSVFYLIMASVLSLLIGALGELLPYEGVILIFSILTIVTCVLTIVRNRSSIEKIYLS
jgi:MFS family permease